MTTLVTRVGAVESQVVASLVFSGDPGSLANDVGPDSFSSRVHADLWKVCLGILERGERLGPLSLRSVWTGDPQVLGEVLDMHSAVAPTGDLLSEFRSATAITKLEKLCRDGAFELLGADFNLGTASQLAHSIAEGALRIAGGVVSTQVDLSIRAAGEQLIEDCLSGDTGVSTGVADIDGRIGGLRPGAFVILLARSGHGKSAFAGTMAEVAASAGHRVLMVSREMPSTELALRFAAHRLDRSQDKIRAALERGEDEVQDQVRRELELPIDVDDESRHIDAVCARVAQASKDPYRIVVLDFLQLFEADGDKQHEQLERLAYAAKNLALRTGCTVIGVAQPNRDGSKAEGLPGMSDIRGSSAIENAADVVISMERRNATHPGAAYELNLSIEKARNGRPGGLGGEYRLGAGTFRVYQESSESRHVELQVVSTGTGRTEF